ncbi:type II toxin-antitoxin system VapB family antitoxin [Rugamonas aquatica]|uniref:Type II toxin-antitoxin system VapB family antitoxin n=1 Tax=Rugamonas aquatica TaxID=2743357 RepID=A0A6A7N7H4_9BURK|nr:type II toxin-antitoxin system VapB family antitoxin [Rugamonas aquatica]MQA41006.1 type II toxin-antitoxin system VapB family antitoxin [Rugamonas aquatica]
MRPDIAISKTLMRQALQASGLKSEQQAIELALRTLIRLHAQEQIRRCRGKMIWDGDLNAMRTDHDPG